MKTLFLALALTTLTWQTAHADEPTPAQEEAVRLAHVQNAQTLEEFLEWATPAEIAEDIGMPIDPESALEDAEDAPALVQISVHLNSHRVDLVAPGLPSYSAPALGGRPGHGTPTGCFRPIGLNKHYWSHKYNAPMPNAVFFSPGVALHTGSLNVPSHGCVHLADSTSSLIYQTVAQYRQNTQICVAHD